MPFPEKASGGTGKRPGAFRSLVVLPVPEGGSPSTAGIDAAVVAGSVERKRLHAVEEATDRLLTTIQGFAEPLLTDMEMELVEIQFRREGHGWVLRLFIDREGGVTIDDCAAVSREISAYLEVEDLIEHAYHLEVSSPGLERPLKKRDDFIRFTGKLARIKLREPMAGQRVFIGTLRGVEGNSVVLVLDGETVQVDMGNISKARLAL